MSERKSILFRPTEEDWKKLDRAIAFHGDNEQGALRRGLSAGDREIDILEEVRRFGTKAAAKGKGTAARKR